LVFVCKIIKAKNTTQSETCTVVRRNCNEERKGEMKREREEREERRGRREKEKSKSTN
jgi:hypothetical protein